jgi:purine-binding chemotaxis protein CheW
MSQTLTLSRTGSAAGQTGSQTGQTILLATFLVRDGLCALDADRIQEVIRLWPLTPLRHAPPEVAGIVSLRGKIVTILDLGLRLGFAKAVPSGDSRIFIMEDCGEFIGLLVDRVDEVVEVERDQWQQAPANGTRCQARVLQGRLPRRSRDHASRCQPGSGGGRTATSRRRRANQ